MADFLKALGRTIELVRRESGCIRYEPMTDLDTDIPTQVEFRLGTITLLEEWESLEALSAHIAEPHMQRFRSEVRSYIKSVSHQVLQPVLQF